MYRPLPAVCLLLPLLAGFVVACQSADAPADASTQIRAAAIERHMRVLAADEMGGRDTGSLGFLRAADYVVEQFESIGLERAGGNESFHQSVPLLSAQLVADETHVQLQRPGGSTALEIERDYILEPDFLRQGVEFVAPMVYVGFGVDAPELDYSDYQGVDVEGKVVVLLRGAPASFPHNERAYHASRQRKAECANAHGAIGLLFMELPAERANDSWERTVTHSRMSAMRWLDDGARPHDVHEGLFVNGLLSVAGEIKLFEAEPYTREQVFAATSAGERLSFDLAANLDVLAATRHERIKSPNLIALLPGSAPEAEYVVLSAHLDHVGATPVEPGVDGIHNGAYDNASGVAILLEIARSLAREAAAPRRSVLFLVTTGEEKGLLGADYFVHQPTVEFARIVAEINLDMVLMFGPLTDVIAFGSEHSSLADAVERATRQGGVELSPDPVPEQAVFVRSDQFAFVRQGIPSLFLASGLDGGSEAALGQLHAWLRDVYHTPADDMTQTFDFEAGAEFARINRSIVAEVASAEERPSWNPGDFFGQRFAGQD